MESPLMFAPLDAGQSRWKSFLVGWGIQAKIILTILAINALFPHQLPQAKRYVVMNRVAPVEPVVKERQPVNPRLAVKPRPMVVETPTVGKLVVPRPVREIRQPEPEVKAPEIELAIKAPELPKLPDAPLAKVLATNT